MKEKPLLIIMIVVFLFLLLGASAFALKSYNDAKANKAQQALEMLKAPVRDKMDEKSDETQENKMKGSLFDLFNKGGNLQCTFSGAQDGQNISGTIYVSGKRMKGVFEIEMEPTTITSNMISDGEFVYTWSDLLPQGIKMKLTDAEGNADADSTTLSPEVLESVKEFQRDYDYDCSEWDVDSALFVVPTNVTFTDFTNLNPANLMETAKDAAKDATENVGEDVGNNMCSTCALIPDPEAKAACMTQFKCN